MALIVLDPCRLGLSETPEGGFALQISDVEGFPEGLKFLLPVGPAEAKEIHSNIGEIIEEKIKVPVASSVDMAKEVARHQTLNDPATNV